MCSLKYGAYLVRAYVCFFTHSESSGCDRLCSNLYELGNVCVVAELPECD